MNIKIMIRVHAWILAIEAFFMIPPLLIALAAGDTPAIWGFFGTIAIALLLASLMSYISRNAPRIFYAREGLVCTGLAWFVLSGVGCLPFILSGRIPNFFDAFFEIVSGFTTTGASVLSDVESLGKALLYWRSFSHWVGGMGVLVFFLAIIPASGRNDGYMLHILRAESPGPSVNKMVPRMRDTAVILYSIYCILTVLDIVFLLIGKLPIFDAVCIAFGTAGTGGFAVLNSGCALYSPFAQYVTTVFMLLFGINFSVYYMLLMKQIGAGLKDEELRLYLTIVAVSILIIAINVFKRTPDTGSAEETFQTAARHARTASARHAHDGPLLPDQHQGTGSRLVGVQLLLAVFGHPGNMLLVIIPGFAPPAHAELPHEVRIIRMNGQRVPEQTITNVHGYLAAYVMIVLFSFLVLCADKANFSLTTNFSSVMANFNNIGPGFDAVGPTSNYSAYSNLSKLIMSVDMLLGRLEIFPILALLAPSTYRKG